eukprot:8807610-Pyramimonas_sp.AAC.1
MQRKSALLLFSDLRGAFYSVVKQFLMPAGHDGDIEEVLRSNETPPCLLEPIKMLLSEPAVLDAVGDPTLGEVSRTAYMAPGSRSEEPRMLPL